MQAEADLVERDHAAEPEGDVVNLEQAATVDRKRRNREPLGPLAGVPVAVKDVFTTRGMPTTCGSRILAGWHPPYDATITRRLKQAGAARVMPAGSPIGSGQGVLNPNNIRIILEYLKDGDPDYPVIVDAGVGTASDVTAAMELGCDGVLLNTGIAHARDPLRMAWAMRYGCEAGRLAFLAGRIPRKLYAQASSPMEGRIASTR